MSQYIAPEAQAAHNLAVAQVAALNQKRNMINTFIFVLNIPIMVLVLLGLSQIHFIKLVVPDANFVTVLAVTAMIALIFMVIRKLAGTANSMFILFTCCTGAIFLPVFYIAVGYMSLLVVSWILPSYLTVSSNLLYGIIAGLVIGICQIPELAKHAEPPALKSEAEQAKELAAKSSS